MDFKIVETSALNPDVLLYRDYNEDSDLVVIIKGYGFIENDESLEEEEVIFSEIETAQSFIRDFSEKSANQWCENRKITYSPES